MREKRYILSLADRDGIVNKMITQEQYNIIKWLEENYYFEVWKDDAYGCILLSDIDDLETNFKLENETNRKEM